MNRIIIISCLFSLFVLTFAYGQSNPAREVPASEQKKGTDKNISDANNAREIKAVPNTNANGARPAKISSAARPSSIRPNQPVNAGKAPAKAPAKGKPANAGKPPGN